MANAAGCLEQLETLKFEFGPQVVDQKVVCLEVLKSAQLKNADQVTRLHEALCFMRAWPDDDAVRVSVDAILDGFDRRLDLKRHADKLINTGIAGTQINFSFYSVTAQWLADCWPDHLHIDWNAFENVEKFERFVNFLGTYSEMLGLENIEMEPSDWIDRLKGTRETDAAFVIKRLAALISNEFLHEQLYDDLDIPLILVPGSDVPSRTRAKYDKSPISYQTIPLTRARPDVREEVRRPLTPPEHVSANDGRRLVELARGSMITRQRDLDAFAYADANDVSVLNDGALQFVLYGVLPQRRFLLETLYGYLVLKNGVPISYGAVTCLFNSAEVAYTVFDSFRGGESTQIYVRILTMAYQVFGCDTFMIDPYQLGMENDDALGSGAWWFYQKLGFRPRDKELLQLMEQEVSAMQRRSRHRSSRAVLKRLATENVYLPLIKQRDDVVGMLNLANVGLKITDLYAHRFGADRELGERTLAAEAASRLGVNGFEGWSAGEKLAWRRWSPLVTLLNKVDRWPALDQEALVRLIRAKGSRHELDYLRGFDGLRRLREAIVSMTVDD